MKTMKFFYYVVCLSLVTTNVLAQGAQTQTRTWKDGDSLFKKIVSFKNVRIDSLVSLIATSDSSEESPDFQLTLPVIDSSWVWPETPKEKVEIIAAEDIEYYTTVVQNDTIIHYVVTDKLGGELGGKIVDVVLSSPETAWNFESDNSNSPRYLNNPVDTYVYMENNQPIFLITDQGNHRVIKVDRVNDLIIWQYGTGSPGDGPNELKFPSDAVALPAGQVLICDQENDRVILVNEAGTILDTLGVNRLKTPVDIEYDSVNKEVLITDQGNDRVIKIDIETDAITWEYNDGLNFPTDADLLSNGNILICDRDSKRLIEVNNNKEIVWDLESPLENLSDADRLPGYKHLVITNGQPFRIGYIDKKFISETKYLGREVSFDSLTWSPCTQVREATSIQMQLRSGKDVIPDTTWHGPTESDLFYTNSGELINPRHNGDNIYQFKAKLKTDDSRYTPVLDNVKVHYRYYDTYPIKGQIISDTINTIGDSIITEWKWLKFNTILPPNPPNSSDVWIKIRIVDLDSVTNDTLARFDADQSDPYNYKELNNIVNLKRKQSIKLLAILYTTSSAVTPILDDWEIVYDVTPLADADIYFVDENHNRTPAYHLAEAGQEPIDYVIVKLEDPNLTPIQNTVKLTVTSLLSQDSVQITLKLQEFENYYLSPRRLPAVISESVVFNNDTLEVYDRDHLVVSYIDPVDSTDQASDTVLIVRNTKGTIQFLERDDAGEIQIEDNYFAPIDTASIFDTIFVYISDEKDQDLTSGQDIINKVEIFDDMKTGDVETLSLFEVPDSMGQYITGDFISAGIPLDTNRSAIPGDTRFQTYGGSRIGVRYDDMILKIPVFGEHRPIPIEAYEGIRSLDFDIAPNPYYSNKHDLLRIRVASAIGDITVEKIEVFNFAGQKISEIPGIQLKFDYDYPIPAERYGYADGWWNLRDQNATLVSSGTYWVKVTGKIENTNKNLSQIKKLVILR